MYPLASNKLGEHPEHLRQTETTLTETRAPEVRSWDPALDPHAPRNRWSIRHLILVGILVGTFALGWCGGFSLHWLLDQRRDHSADGIAIKSIVERIIQVESNGDPNAKNKRSSATGLGQFLDETWLDLIRTYRPDLARGRGKGEILELRRDANLAREITSRFTEQNAGMLRKRGLPITPGTLYLAHFAAARELSPYCQRLSMQMRPRSWPTPMQRVELSERRSLRLTHSSNVLRCRSQELGRSQDARSSFVAAALRSHDWTARGFDLVLGERPRVPQRHKTRPRGALRLCNAFRRPGLRIATLSPLTHLGSQTPK